ncbi:hypothetical protein M1N05_01090 [Dehalococcoidales bacterium]|nr:hypothetical protein [Dehalococcoidales bacterium]
MKVAVPLVGLAMSVFHAGIIARNIDADFWRSSIGLIEGNPDFWEYTESGNLVQGTDNGRATRQAQQPLRLSQLPGFINFIKHPNPIFGFWLPLLIFIGCSRSFGVAFSYGQYTLKGGSQKNLRFFWVLKGGWGSNEQY